MPKVLSGAGISTREARSFTFHIRPPWPQNRQHDKPFDGIRKFIHMYVLFYCYSGQHRLRAAHSSAPACVSSSACTHGPRGQAPAPVLPASANRARSESVRSFQPAKPSGQCGPPDGWPAPPFFRWAARAAPDTRCPAGSYPTQSRQSQNTKPRPSALPDGAVTQLWGRPLFTVRSTHCSNRASAPPKMKSMSPAISQSW